MKNKCLLGVLPIFLLIIGICTASALAQEQICYKVDGPLFSVSDDPSVPDWNCQRVADPDAAFRNNVMGMRDFRLNVGYLRDIEGFPFDNDDANGALCFEGSDPEHPEVMISTFQLRFQKKKPIGFIFWAHGYDINGLVDVTYMIQYVDGPIAGPDTVLPPEPYTTTEVNFANWLIETEGRGKLRKETCTGTETLESYPPPHLLVSRCEEQDPVDPDDPYSPPQPCP